MKKALTLFGLVLLLLVSCQGNTAQTDKLKRIYLEYAEKTSYDGGEAIESGDPRRGTGAGIWEFCPF